MASRSIQWVTGMPSVLSPIHADSCSAAKQTTINNYNNLTYKKREKYRNKFTNMHEYHVTMYYPNNCQKLMYFLFCVLVIVRSVRKLIVLRWLNTLYWHKTGQPFVLTTADGHLQFSSAFALLGVCSYSNYAADKSEWYINFCYSYVIL